MDLKNLKYLDNISKAAPFENYFVCYPNNSYTAIDLKILRTLAFLLKKLILIPHFNGLSYKILAYMYQSFNQRRFKIEKELLETTEPILIVSSQPSTNLNHLYTALSNMNKHQPEKQFFYFIKKLLFILKNNGDCHNFIQSQQANSDLINITDFNYVEALCSPEFLSKNTEKILEQIFRDKVVQSAHYVLLYAKFKKENQEMEKAIDLLDIYHYWEGPDSILIRKTYIMYNFEIKAKLEIEELQKVVQISQNDEEFLHLLVDYIDVLRSYGNKSQGEKYCHLQLECFLTHLVNKRGSILCWTRLERLLNENPNLSLALERASEGSFPYYESDKFFMYHYEVLRRKDLIELQEIILMSKDRKELYENIEKDSLMEQKVKLIDIFGSKSCQYFILYEKTMQVANKKYR